VKTYYRLSKSAKVCREGTCAPFSMAARRLMRDGSTKIRSRVEHEGDAREVWQDVGKNRRPALTQGIKIALPICLAGEVIPKSH